MGASSKGAGYSATHTHMTNSWNTPVEAFEHQYPLRIESYRVRGHSGGAVALHRGGDGIVREFLSPAPAEVTILSDRAACADRTSLAGGEPGQSAAPLLRAGRKPLPLPAIDPLRNRGRRRLADRNPRWRRMR